MLLMLLALLFFSPLLGCVFASLFGIVAVLFFGSGVPLTPLLLPPCAASLAAVTGTEFCKLAV
jgi:hypothetical protein